MGSIWRNREFRRYMAVMVAAGAIGAVVCALLHPAAGVAAAATALVMLTASCLFTGMRYRRIAEFSNLLARIAAGDYRVNVNSSAEGELSILSSELFRLTSMLSHQAGRLEKDKTFLADSLADISHQLKTPLTSVSMLAELLETPDLPEEKRQEFLAGMRTGLDRIQWLISALLRLSRLDAGAVVFQPGRYPLIEILDEAADFVRVPANRRHQSLTVETDGEVTVDTDRQWLVEAVGNLIKNCVEHTPDGGTVRVLGLRNALYTEIRIQDSGPGFCPEDLPHLFERFYRGAHATADSVGIGLALSKSIIRSLGGTITAENAAEGGACYTVRFYGGTVV